MKTGSLAATTGEHDESAFNYAFAPVLSMSSVIIDFPGKGNEHQVKPTEAVLSPGSASSVRQSRLKFARRIDVLILNNVAPEEVSFFIIQTVNLHRLLLSTRFNEIMGSWKTQFSGTMSDLKHNVAPHHVGMHPQAHTLACTKQKIKLQASTGTLHSHHHRNSLEAVQETTADNGQASQGVWPNNAFQDRPSNDHNNLFHETQPKRFSRTHDTLFAREQTPTSPQPTTITITAWSFSPFHPFGKN
ncbi:hypothetical protein Fmac_023985 [Flemingia macrophylla]|uniref:Uncharacterized protein n=1 Tax=Flemingia macrophylla TaxID=520843 RepID=A0ABD1LN24_9FABA